MGVLTSVRGKFNRIVDSGENQEPEAKDSAKTLIADDRNNGDERAQSARASPINSPPVVKVSGWSWFEKAAEILDTIGSSMSNEFSSGPAMKGNKISILAFEVARTIRKGSRLMQSLSDENISFLKTTVFSSKGVQTLISEDNDELMRIAAADKREEFESFLREVIRFGNLCKDPQWRNLDLYFEKLGREFTPQKQSAKHLKAESAMQRLMTLVQHTASLSSELCAMDEVHKVYFKCRQEENISSVVQRGDFANLQADIKNRRKLVKALKKKSLWSRSFEEVVEKLVDIVNFVLLKMNEAFGNADGYKPVEGSDSNKKKLGPVGIALHYATIITQIDTLVTLSGSAPLSLREALYQRLPRSITSALRVTLKSFQVDMIGCHLIKAEMEKTLQWLSPIARNTIKALRGFGHGGGLANFGSEVSREVSGQTDVMRIETLYHADKEKTEACIFELLVWLHSLISQARYGGVASSSNPPNHRSRSSMLSVKDKEMLANVGGNVFKTGVRSKNFAASKTKISKLNRLTKSSREYPMSGATKKDPIVRWPSCDPVIDFDICWIKTLDVIDGLESI